MSTWTKVRDAVESFFTGPVWDFLKPFAAILESEGSSILIAAAEDAVTAGFAAPGNGEAKMAVALASFSAEVIAKGLPFIESQARALIEVALQKAKVATQPAA
jgi:hypothetical protein